MIPLLHFQQRAVATESCAKRRQPPAAAGRVVSQRVLEHEINEWTAQIAKLPQHSRAPAQIVFRQSELFLHRHQHVTSSRSEEHTSELQSQSNLVCRLLLEKKKHTKQL